MDAESLSIRRKRMAKLWASSSSDDSRRTDSASFTRPRALLNVSSVTDNPLPKHFCLRVSKGYTKTIPDGTTTGGWDPTPPL